MTSIAITFNGIPMQVAAEDVPPIGDQNSVVSFLSRWNEYANSTPVDEIETTVPDFLRQAMIAKGFTDSQIDQMKITLIKSGSSDDIDLRTGNECCASPQVNEDGSCDACGACCRNEDRSHNGGCRSCGDPCF